MLCCLHTLVLRSKESIKRLCRPGELSFSVYRVSWSFPSYVQRQITELSRERRSTVWTWNVSAANLQLQLPFPVYNGLERLSRLIGADMTLTFENGKSMCGVSTRMVLDFGRRVARV